ncbi:ribonuclease H-like protein [Dendrothele bispora CBS 962.96]|uniref:ribonuclease H n=1 Tax=Dendrothele bispora (strain CBS 962.96) TaxID=1314807 RepID=A0A4S8LEW4_DENBC|nr:ribonuclease H-like protein [Dendrothele bispora CBS 962.96]THU86998.1 ribonuclease H-like protein [Dendrothele bispora CBS 962.96]
MDPSLHLLTDEPGISNRLLKFCEHMFYTKTLSELTTKACKTCDRFYGPCCGHYEQSDLYPCHHFKLVFTDGACLNNGAAGTQRGGVTEVGRLGGGGGSSRAGIGAAAGQMKAEQQRSKPIDDTMDPGMPRTNQRAELLGALEGLDLLLTLWKEMLEEAQKGKKRVHGEGKKHRSKSRTAYYEDDDEDEDDGSQKWIVATDSEYVVKGITQWYPAWKARDWRTANGKTPVNLDLFHRLNNRLSALEAMNVEVGFWKIPREYNKLADKLAGEAALRAPA